MSSQDFSSEDSISQKLSEGLATKQNFLSKELLGYLITVYLEESYPGQCFLLKISDRSILFSVEDNRFIDTKCIKEDIIAKLESLKGVEPLPSDHTSIYTDRPPSLNQGLLRYDSFLEEYPEVNSDLLKNITNSVSNLRVKKKSRSLRFEFTD